MSASITKSVVAKQLRAMGCELFEIGVLHRDGRMVLRSGWNAERIDSALNWLRRENARGAHIFVRPAGAHALSLVDDLSAEAITRMTNGGFEPSLVIETSVRNFQVWLNHGRTLPDRTFSTLVAKELARRFGGDPSSADWRHFGRLAGFTNQKPKRRLPSGLPPFVRLRQAEGSPYRGAREFLQEVKSIAEKERAERPARTTPRSTSIQESVRPLAEFQMDPRYGGDLHRADMAWALHAATRGLSEQRIRDQILLARDLSKKGGLQRQLDYTRRTAIKAIRTVDQLG
jgi:hypothetical protein